MSDSAVTRREVLGGTVAGLAVVPLRAGAASPLRAPETAAPMVNLSVNGKAIAMPLDPRTSLLDALREHAGLTGTKKGCDHGSCGACTVHVDGKRMLACLLLASRLQGRAITTIEGLAQNDTLHPMQAAFVAHDGLQCGYCTPGQIMSAVALIQEGHAGSQAEIAEWMSGNICRCGAYTNIRAAIADVAHQQRS